MATTTSRKVFINLAVEDLQRSIDFFTALGFSFDPQFTDEQATCMILSDEAFVMLLVKSRFADFITKEVSDSSTSTEAIIALSAVSRAEVDELVGKALAAGGSPSMDKLDMGFMYSWSFQDPDGHLWEVMHMGSGAAPPA